MGKTKAKFVESTETVSQELITIKLDKLKACGYTIKNIVAKTIDGCFCIAVTYLGEPEEVA